MAIVDNWQLCGAGGSRQLMRRETVPNKSGEQQILLPHLLRKLCQHVKIPTEECLLSCYWVKNENFYPKNMREMQNEARNIFMTGSMFSLQVQRKPYLRLTGILTRCLTSLC